MEKALKYYQLVVILYFILMGIVLFWTKHFVGGPIYFALAAAFIAYVLKGSKPPNSTTS